MDSLGHRGTNVDIPGGEAMGYVRTRLGLQTVVEPTLFASRSARTSQITSPGLIFFPCDESIGPVISNVHEPQALSESEVFGNSKGQG